MTKEASLTPLGKALRERDADLRSAWEHDYTAAIAAALAGDAARQVDLLRARRPLTDGDFDALADYVEATAKRGRGRERNEPVHAAAQIAEAIMDVFPGNVADEVREAVIGYACRQIERESGTAVDPEQVRDLLRRPTQRRRSKRRLKSRI